jgi:hypothetical protein
MDAKDVAQLFIAATDKIQFYWNFYVVMLIALIGWLVSTKSTLTISLKLLLTVGYLVFVAMNIVGLVGSYTFAEALRNDLLTMDGAKALLHTHKVLEAHSFMQQRVAAIWIHAIVGVAVLLVIWFGRFGSPSGGSSEKS